MKWFDPLKLYTQFSFDNFPYTVCLHSVLKLMSSIECIPVCMWFVGKSNPGHSIESKRKKSDDEKLNYIFTLVSLCSITIIIFPIDAVIWISFLFFSALVYLFLSFFLSLSAFIDPRTHPQLQIEHEFIIFVNQFICFLCQGGKFIRCSSI